MPPTPRQSIGQSIRHYRERRGMTATQLAVKTGLSKSYISELEAGQPTARGPSAAVLYEIAKALEVAMADLLGKPVLVSAESEQKRARPTSLVDFGKRFNVPEPDLRMLESIKFRGGAPKTVEQWWVIYQAIKSSSELAQ